MQVTASDLPKHAFLARDQALGSFTDCYVCEVAVQLSLPQFIAAFYTTWLFRAERLLLRAVPNGACSDADIENLAQGRTDGFSIWTQESRREDQIQLIAGRTKSWLHVAPNGEGLSTKLYFGSAVRANDAGKMGGMFHVLSGFHALYARKLLSCAAVSLESAHRP